MKKIIAPLILLTLVGFGCTKPVAPTNTPPENKAQVDQPALTFTTDDGKTVTTNAGTNAKPTETDKDGVPIIDVQLGGTGSGWVRTFDLKIGNYFFEPKIITVKAGEKFRVDFRGVAGTHTFVMDEPKVKETIKDGSGIEITAPTKPGSYPFYCDVENHKASGMTGTLIVQ